MRGVLRVDVLVLCLLIAALALAECQATPSGPERPVCGGNGYVHLHSPCGFQSATIGACGLVEAPCVGFVDCTIGAGSTPGQCDVSVVLGDGTEHHLTLTATKDPLCPELLDVTGPSQDFTSPTCPATIQDASVDGAQDGAPNDAPSDGTEDAKPEVGGD